jgi:hypothetical protein
MAMALFDGPDLRGELERRMNLALDEVRAMDDDYLLNAPEEELVTYLLDTHGMGTVTIHANQVSTVASGVLEKDHYGNRIATAAIRVPFDGPTEIFGYQPNLYGPQHPTRK